MISAPQELKRELLFHSCAEIRPWRSGGHNSYSSSRPPWSRVLYLQNHISLWPYAQLTVRQYIRLVCVCVTDMTMEVLSEQGAWWWLFRSSVSKFTMLTAYCGCN
jgi:hypothetical protein